MCGCLSHDPYWKPYPATQEGALTGNRTGDPFVCRSVLNPLSHTSHYLKYKFYSPTPSPYVPGSDPGYV